MGKVVSIAKFVKTTPETRGTISKKHGSNKLYLDFYYRGTRIVKTTGLDDTFENREKTQEWLSRNMERISKGTFVFAEAFPGASPKEKERFSRLEGRDYKPEPQNVVFGDYAKSWVKRFLDDCPSKSKSSDQKEAFEYWISPHFGRMTFAEITGVALKEFLGKLVRKSGKKKGQSLSASRVRNILIPLRSLWGDACEEHGWDLQDPFNYIRKHKLVPKRRRRTRVRYEVFRFDEWKQLMEVIDPYYRVIAEFMVMTGMIGSEIAGLRKEEDILEQEIWIRNSVIRDHEKSDLKTEYRERKFLITQALRRLLDEALSMSKGKYVFTMKSGRPFDVDSFRKNAWTSALKRTGIPYKVPYTTRHTFAAWALAMGTDPNRLTTLMGHGSKEMVYEVYGKYVDGLETDAGNITEYFGKDFVGLKGNRPSAFAINRGESGSESD